MGGEVRRVQLLYQFGLDPAVSTSILFSMILCPNHKSKLRKSRATKINKTDSNVSSNRALRFPSIVVAVQLPGQWTLSFLPGLIACERSNDKGAFKLYGYRKTCILTDSMVDTYEQHKPKQLVRMQEQDDR